MSVPVWTYWEGKRPPIIDLCLESITRHNPAARVLDPKTIRELGGGHVLEATEGLLPAIRSDLIRFWLLKTFGGVWIDSDSVATLPLDFLGEIPHYDFIAIYNKFQKQGWGTNGLIASPAACARGSPFAEACFTYCFKLVKRYKQGERLSYGITSVGTTSRFFKLGRYRVLRMEHWRYNPVPWPGVKTVMTSEGASHHWEYGPHWNPNACLYHLTNTVAKPLHSSTREQILGGKTLLAFILQKALGLTPAVPLRAWEILQRFPRDRPIRGVEIGTYYGGNARNLLQQARKLHLTCVDPWGNLQSPEYRATGDSMAFLSNAQWNRLYTTCCRRVAFAGNRVELWRTTSEKAFLRMPPRSLDLVFIDGNHSYPAVKRDLRWREKIKPGGLLCGHDYNHPRGSKYRVTQALDEFIMETGLRLELGQDTTWFIRL